MIKKLNNRGATSVMWIIIIMVAVTIISGFIGILNRTMLLNEIQGIIDMSGVMALRYAADEQKLRSQEELYVDTGIAKNKFLSLIKDNLEEYTGEGRMIRDYNVESVSVLKDDQTALGAGGIQGRQEYFLEAVISATYDLESIIDSASINSVNYFDFLWTNENSRVAVVDTAEDGQGNVIIRTVSRLALR